MINDLTKDDPRTYAVIGAAMEVHRVLGCGFLEPVYQKALAVEFTNRKILFRREKSFPVCPDFICLDTLVVELKALARIGGIEQSQVINYLKVTGHEIALLLNFGTRSLEYRRFVLTNSQSSRS